MVKGPRRNRPIGQVGYRPKFSCFGKTDYSAEGFNQQIAQDFNQQIVVLHLSLSHFVPRKHAWATVQLHPNCKDHKILTL